jgi:acyl-CoA synthetase (AMP-forming)/AMP-acid ligase II
MKRLMTLPFFHAASAPATHTSPLRGGTLTYIMRRFDLELFLKNIEKYQITEMILVPPVVIAIIMSPANKKYSLKSVRAVTIGAAPLDKGSQQRLLELIGPDAKVTQVWGMTETSCVCTQFRWPEKDHTGSVGRLVANMEIKYVYILAFKDSFLIFLQAC